MTGLREIISAATSAARDGRSAVLATVVKVTGSAYRRPGARMLFAVGCEPIGMVSGGCLEADLAERAGQIGESGGVRTVVYDMRSPDDIVWGLGLGCDGEVRVLLERLSPEDPPGLVAFLEGCRRSRRPGVVATVFDGRGDACPAVGGRLMLDAAGTASGALLRSRIGEATRIEAARALSDRCTRVVTLDVEGGRVELLVEYVAPEIDLLVFGAGGDAVPLVHLARGLGWRVRVADERPALLARTRFPGADALVPVRYQKLDPRALEIDGTTAVVVMTHHFLHDLDLLVALIASDAPYIGLLGPRRRTAKLLDQLRDRGVRPTPEQLARLYGPVGVDIGSETPEEIALSALAEIRAVLSGRDGGFLRDRSGPLH